MSQRTTPPWRSAGTLAGGVRCLPVTEGDAKMGLEITGIWGLIILVLDIWAIISIIGSGTGTGAKVLWTLLVILLPVIGFIIWLIFGPRSGSARL